MVTDGAFRDVAEVRALGFHYFMKYPVVSHSNFWIESVGEPIELDGQRVVTGDILHGDANGIVIVPEAVLAGIGDAVTKVRSSEQSTMEYIRSADFDYAEFKTRAGLLGSVAPVSVAHGARPLITPLLSRHPGNPNGLVRL